MAHKILIVDDEPHVTAALKRMLRNEPYEILSANYANEALQLLAREAVSVVISDEKMPGIQGTEFLALVNQHFPNTIRIMLTGHANLEVAKKAINEGQIYRFLEKPCSEWEIRNTIREAIKKREIAENTLEQ